MVWVVLQELSSSERNSECFSVPRHVGQFQLPTLWEQFGDGPSCSNMTVHQCTKQLHEETMREFGVDELDWPAQSPDLNLIEHHWDESQRRLRARPSRPTSTSDLTDALLEEWSKIPL